MREKSWLKLKYVAGVIIDVCVNNVLWRLWQKVSEVNSVSYSKPVPLLACFTVHPVFRIRRV